MGGKQTTVIDGLVAEKICAYRKLRKLSQTALATELGVTFQQIRKYEKGINRVGAARLYEIAAFFKVPIQALFPAEGEAGDCERSSSDNESQIAQFSLSAEGWQLCRAFLKISDNRKRKMIIALVKELVDR